MDQGQDFSTIALAKFLQGCPELGNSIISFKDVSSDLTQTDDIKVGVFILRVGTSIFYVPVIAKVDNVYPIDSVFFAEKSKFFPITKKTIEIIITSSKLTHGNPAKIPATVSQNPDLTTLITPPRTGKFVYASQSRLEDFLASMPTYLKNFTFEKIAAEQSAYQQINKLFNVSDIFAALKSPSKAMAAETNKSPVSIVTGASTSLTKEEIAGILENGYSVRGVHPTTRIAVSSINYDDNMFTSVGELDGNTDYELVFKNGTSREAFIPKFKNIGQNGTSRRKSVALFTNGEYSVSEDFVAVGTKLNRTNVLDSLFESSPPVLPRDVEVGNSFAVIDTDANLVGVFSANKVILSNLGVEIECSAIAGFPEHSYTICAYRNYGLSPSVEGTNIYIPFSSLVIKLGMNVTYDMEFNPNSAARKREISEAGILNDQLNLGYDGVEFSVNGKVAGVESNLMSLLVVDEGIDPELAMSFVKQAKENKFAKIYLSKKASTDFRPGEIPQQGNILEPTPKVGLNGSFMPNVQSSLMLSNAQATEATIISELLQTPDMFSLIEEYQPDLEECIDKLGRILFLSRVHINQLAEGNDTDSIFSFLASLKAVYRMLGDNYLKLQEMLTIKPEVDSVQ